ncbi:hypothetical protein HYALB_00011499 [Hymenoscyphus albidus]|uniref:Uncharacterized protein n=1 Tax=Hymenoscyphus albidus TaxID=595503 RepID=A0A9N9LRW5_9HELO|nr:hypothetical protein HYALB_00011499 [Hymenoscyphus albidus]
MASLEDLMQEIFRIAEDYLEGIVDEQMDEEKVPSVDKCMKYVRDDRDFGGVSIQLLRSIPRPVIAAMIDGTIGHKLATSQEFERLFHDIDHCAGVYLNTFVVSGTKKGLCRNQLQEIHDMMMRYIAGKGRKVDANSSAEDKEAAEEAAKIEWVYNPGHRGLDTFRETTNDGGRKLIQGLKGQAEKFCRMLLRYRANAELDPEGTTPQLQSPCQVGCGQAITNRMFMYSPTSGMKHVPKTWSLMLSCLQVMDIKVTHISVPILKVWDGSHLSLAEILITELASSLIEYGGFNPVAAGARKLKPEKHSDFRQEVYENFLHHPWANQNLRESKEIADKRIEIMNSTQSIAWDTTQVKKVEDSLDEVSETLTEAIEETKRNTEVLQGRTKELIEDAARLRTEKKRLGKELSFKERLEKHRKEAKASKGSQSSDGSEGTRYPRMRKGFRPTNCL